MTDPAVDTSSEGLQLSPLCIHLRSKKALFLGRAPQTDDDVMDASCACWCRKTMQAVGPDGESVTPADCRSERTCFQSIL